ncbi:hypothetical protein P7C71_g3562, partial [Lecanoromycetidae sp. Uapishka_2]
MDSYAARLASFNAAHVIAKKRTSDARGAKQAKWPHKHPSPPQSNLTALTEGDSVAEIEGNLDESILSNAETAKPTKSTKGGKKAAKSKKASGKAKGKAAKAKQEDSHIASSFLEPEDDDFEVKVAQAPAPDTKCKKRKSEEISVDADSASHAYAVDNVMEPQAPPKKRRATRARDSAGHAQEEPDKSPHSEGEVDTNMPDAEVVLSTDAPASKKKGRPGKKRASSKARKVSNASMASKASLRVAVPDDEDIDEALEADLNRPLTDEEGDTEPIEIEKPKSRRLTRTKPGSRKATASIASTRRGTRASTMSIDDTPMTNLYPSIPHIPDVEPQPVASETAENPTLEEHIEPLPLPKPKNAKGKVLRKTSKQQQRQEQPVVEPEETNVVVDEPTSQQVNEKADLEQPRSRQVSRQLPARRTRASNMPIPQDPIDLVSDVNSSTLGAQTVHDDSGHETDAGVARQGRTKRGTGKTLGAVKKGKARKLSTATSSNIEDVVVPSPAEEEVDEPNGQPNVVVHVAPKSGDDAQHVSIDIDIPKEQPKTTRALVKGTKAKKIPTKSQATAPKAPEPSSSAQPSRMADIRDEPVISPPSVHSTPRQARSPQSSDAENQPPSSRPSSLRPPLSMQSPSRSQTMRVPLAVTTPTASPARGNFSKLQSTFPWTAVDLEQIFRGSPSPDKENDPFAVGRVSGKAEGALTSPEKKLSVEQWIQFNAQRGEEKLRNECERLVGKFESQGMRALKTLEGIVAAE